ncbi:glycosyltransferase family 2 protein [Streptococcus himalayensis]|uniref:Glycosyl transferase n=1 Tax=Streptococcus himalayensis TaxID=1888195 RepID=A0A917EDL2_9STRE|nr:glycosyltransferase family 2 protein [Streptococcus himalayensis]GGE27879.1 glycosyl transferase [Streptococcus himalayensis]
MRFSIIIPAYNIESYIEEAVESVVLQEYDQTNYEIIIVNDGSTDQTGNICDTFESQYSQVRVIHQKNGGLSRARNTGIQSARGDYLLFLDGDDFWSDVQFLKGLSSIIDKNEVDMLVFPFSYFYNNTHKSVIAYHWKERVGDFYANAISLTSDGVMNPPAWNKCVKRDLFLSSDSLKFIEGRLSEDVPWCAACLKNIGTYAIYDNPQYMYRQNRIGSITNQVKEKSVQDILQSIDEGLSDISEQTPTIQKALSIYFATVYISILPFTYPYRYNQSIAHFLKKYRYLLKYRSYIKNKEFRLTGTIAAMGGLVVSSFILNKLLYIYNLYKGKK